MAEDAEDVLQEAWLRFAGACVQDLQHPRAYLVTIVTRLALDQMRSARHRREDYVGLWLPEPVPSEEAQPPELAEQAESASFAFLLLLERLNPVERAVLVLHDVFDYSHEEIGRITDRTAVASRQTLSRARRRLGAAPPPPPAAPDDERVPAFVRAMGAGDVRALLQILAPDVVLMSDGGGLVRAEVTALNGQPALLAYVAGVLDTAFLFDVTGAGITAIYAVRNPQKLRRLAALRP